MKNKLFKTLTCFVAISAIGSTVAIVSTSCGCSNEQSIKALPESVYDIDENNVLQGFKNDFINNPDSEIYQDNFKDCDTMIIPAKVTSIANYAFEYWSGSSVPDYIKNLTFAKGSNCSSINLYAFTKSPFFSITLPNSLTSIGDHTFGFSSNISTITFPSSLNTIGDMSFSFCQKLTKIIWIGLNSQPNIGQDSFDNLPNGGIVQIVNSEGSYTSNQLLSLLISIGSLPNDWQAK